MGAVPDADRRPVPVRRGHASGRRDHRPVRKERGARHRQGADNRGLPVAPCHEPLAARCCPSRSVCRLAGLPARGRRRFPSGSREQPAARSSRWKRGFSALPDPARIRDTHRLLTQQPHPAGSRARPRARRLDRGAVQEAGLQDVQITHARRDAAAAGRDQRRADRSHSRGAPRCASRRSRPSGHRDRDPPSAPAASRLLRVWRRHARRWSTPAAASPPTTSGCRAQGIDVRGRIVLVRHNGARRYRGAAVWRPSSAAPPES